MEKDKKRSLATSKLVKSINPLKDDKAHPPKKLKTKKDNKDLAIQEEFAFGANKESDDFLESQLEHFMNNYDDLIKDLGKNIKDNNNASQSQMNKNNSDPKGDFKVKDEKSKEKKLRKKNHSTNFNDYNSMKDKLEENTLERSDSKESKNSKTSKTSKKSKRSKMSKKFKKSSSKKDLVDLNNLITQVPANQPPPKEEKDEIKNLTSIEEIKDYYEYTENCLKMINTIKPPPESEIEELMIELPDKYNKKKLAIFDLDETLIHCVLKQPQNSDKLITITLPNKKKARVSKYFYHILGWIKYSSSY